MTPVTAGHKVTYAIVYLDALGNPMLTTPTPDSPAAWTDAPSAPGIDTLTVDPTGNSAVLQTNPTAPAGSDVVTMTVVVGGQTFTATDSVVISAAPQVLTSVQIVGTVQ